MNKRRRQQVMEASEISRGRKLAKSCFDNYFKTGQCSPGSAEYQNYCEMFAGAMRNGEPITPHQVSLIDKVKEDKATPFYEGVCDFLLERIAEYQKPQMEKEKNSYGKV